MEEPYSYHTSCPFISATCAELLLHSSAWEVLCKVTPQHCWNGVLYDKWFLPMNLQFLPFVSLLVCLFPHTIACFLRPPSISQFLSRTSPADSMVLSPFIMQTTLLAMTPQHCWKGAHRIIGLSLCCPFSSAASANMSHHTAQQLMVLLGEPNYPWAG